MKTIKLLCLTFVITCIGIVETTAEPCSTAVHLPVINICTDDTKFQDSTDALLIKVDKRQNCTCELSIINQHQAITVRIQKFNQEKTSSPSHFGCGVIMTFTYRYGTVWEAQCIVSNYLELSLFNISDVMTIRSLTVNGTLARNEGYCIEIRKAVNDSTGNKLKLTCGTTEYSTTTTSSETTRSSTEITTSIPLRLTTYTNQLSTRIFEIDEFTFATATNTDVSVSTTHTNQQKIDEGNDETTIYVAISVTVGGVATIIIGTIMVIYNRRFRILTQCKNMTYSGSNTMYDTLSLPSSANVADNTSIRNNYSSLNINDFQSSCDIRRFGGTQNIPLSTISKVQGNKTTVMKQHENERNYENTNKKRSEYANLVF